MKQLRCSLLLLLLLSKLCGFSQSGALKVEILELGLGDSSRYLLLMVRAEKSDTVLREVISHSYSRRIPDLQTGQYELQLFSLAKQSERRLFKTLDIKKDSLLQVTLAVSVVENYVEVYQEIDSTRILSKYEPEMHFAYTSNTWMNSDPAVPYAFSIAMGGYHWQPWSKHVGGMIGGGWGFSHAQIASDTSFSMFNKIRKINEYSHYVYGQLDVRLRLTADNQKTMINGSQKLMADVGICYNLPLYYRQITRYPGDNKLVKNRLHQFTDARAYVNIGFSQVLFFVEYRLSDFVMGANPEIPRYMAGIRLFSFEQN